jgi:uncharacterized protein (DUF58 family)
LTGRYDGADVTGRGRHVLILAGATYAAAWLFGSTPLYPVATGLALAVLGARLWVGEATRPLLLRRRVQEGPHVEGDDVIVIVELEREGAVPPPSITLVEHVGRLGERRTTMRARRARYVLQNLPRGRYAFEDTRAVIEDPFGLARGEVLLLERTALLVHPRVVELDGLFSDGAGTSFGGRRLLLRRTAGFDVHSVREYEHGDSLRRVHWPSTARRGELMVKELEDSPREEVAVVLDAAPSPVFDLQARIAASLVRAQARRGRAAVLVVNGLVEERAHVRSLAGDWRAALDLLAAAEPQPGRAVETALGRVGAPEVVLVTGSLTPRLVERLLQLAAEHRRVSLVLAQTRRVREPALLRLQGAGVSVVVTTETDDLAVALGTATRAAARA